LDKDTKEKLTVFQLVLTPADLVRGPAGRQYFELHPGELPYPNACHLEGSLFIRDAAFDFFAGCFHTASESFNYFSFQRFGVDEINCLKIALDLYLKDIKDDTARGQLFSRFASVTTPTFWDAVETTALAAAVFHCGQTIRAFIELKTRQSGCLWVLGL
jgi:hypothetical protein